jgi:ParB-like chromosome segregation protein Spo0J
MKYTNALVKFGEITAGENPRLPTNLSLDSLRDNIEGVGLLEPITLWEKSKNVLELIRGHRRTLAIGQIKNRNPKRFEELFGKGIPALVVTGITPEEVITMKLDHSEQRGLSDPHELQRSANMLFAISKTEAEVAVQLAGLK